MESEELRHRILKQHEALREQIRSLEVLAREVAEAEEGGDLAPALRRGAERLLRRLEAHRCFEDENLGPALVGADAWGSERRARLTADHAEQRRLLREVFTALRSPRVHPAVVVRRILHLTDHLKADMRDEEAALLDPAVLRDDVVGTDVITG